MSTKSSTLTVEKTKNKTVEKKKIRVWMYNDNTTSFDVVEKILMEVFKKTKDEAGAIAMAIHLSGENGKKVVGEYSRTIADAKVAKAKRMASEEGYPNFKVKADK